MFIEKQIQLKIVYLRKVSVFFIQVFGCQISLKLLQILVAMIIVVLVWENSIKKKPRILKFFAY